MTKKYILVGTVLVLLGTSGCSYIPTENISYGVYYNDTDLSNTPKNELQARLQEVNDKIPQTISIDMGNNKKQQATYHDLGIQFDTEAMVKAISTYGYEDDMWTVLSHRFNGLFYGHHFKPQYKLDEVKGKTYLTELAKTIDTPGHDAYLTVENGQVVIHPSKEGKRIDIDATLKKLKDDLQISDSINSLSMVFTTQNTVKVTDTDLKPLNTVLASFTTEYNLSNESRTYLLKKTWCRWPNHFDPNNESRTHNIQLASDKINGTLIKPGAQFSFNDVVGERTAEAGYDDAPVMIDGKLVPGIGGGICQVSSTIFNTALLSGMNIVEPHFEPVGYIQAGRDATVAWGFLDFKFRNPYQHSIYILSVMNNGTLTIYIIGTAEDKPKNVSISVGDYGEIPNKTITKVDSSLKEKEVQEGHVGLKMNTYRTITYGNWVTQTDSFESVYDPVDTIITMPATPEVPPKKTDKKKS